MKRLALLTITAFAAILISACGETVERKTEPGATQQQGTTPTPGAPTTPGGTSSEPSQQQSGQ